MMRTRAAPVVLVALALVCAALAVRPEISSSPSAVESAAVATPVFSARRAPTLLARYAADAHLSIGLDHLTADAALGPAQEANCLSVIDGHGHTIYTKNASTPLIPASNMKLMTATAALQKLGPDYRFETDLRGSGGVAPDGTLNGDLFLVGGGDPFLGTADFGAVAGFDRKPRLTTPLEQLADSAVAAGLKRITGRVIGDEGRYDTQRYLPSWSPLYIRDSEVGPLSALTVNGGFESWQPPIKAAADPAANAANVFTTLLKGRGVAIGGDGAAGRAPGSAGRLTSIQSAPLSDVIGVMLRESDNMAAELLVKELGVHSGGGGSTQAGVQVVQTTLQGVLPDLSAFSSVDGSGLDRSDRLSCNLLQSLLTKEGTQGMVAQDLPVAGRDGTLAKRFIGTPAAGKVKAKTGSLRGVVALSGWVTANDGAAVQFSFVVNDLPLDAQGTALENGLVSTLASYPSGPAAGDLGPLPPRARPPS